jgi:tetratricopeptide (TPR) repeat protein
MWYLWEKEYNKALDSVKKFLKQYPDSKLRINALKTGREAFDLSLNRELGEKDFPRIVKTWDTYSFLRDNPDLTPQTRIVVATSLWKTGSPDRALLLAKPFLEGTLPFSIQSEMAMDLMLEILTLSKSWYKIIDIGKQVKRWKLDNTRKQQLDYTIALANENMGNMKQANNLWQKLAADITLSQKKRAYALYFLAQHALDNEKLEDVYIFAQEALSLFMQDNQDTQKIKNCLDLLIRTTERTGKNMEALGWGLEYSKYITPDNPDWPAFTYRLSTLYKALSDLKMWKKTLEKIIALTPASVYAKMAGSDLEEGNLQDKLKKYQEQ